MVKNKHLDFAQLIFDQLVASISWNKRYSYVPYPHRLFFFLAHIRYGYIGVANDSIFKSTMSSKLINATATLYNHLVTKWVTNKVLNSYKDDICPFSPNGCPGFLICF